jgi:hypothetical protein
VGPNGGPDSYRITVTVASFGPGLEGYCQDTACETEEDGTIYRRRSAGGDVPQAYLLPRATTQVMVIGGEAVGRQLLHRAVLAARPATDAEILRNLRPLPGQSLGERYRSWLKEHFG